MKITEEDIDMACSDLQVALLNLILNDEEWRDYSGLEQELNNIRTLIDFIKKNPEALE
jgi:SpoVK/Ycf46/Vps4 family AAA+-type ATPase